MAKIDKSFKEVVQRDLIGEVEKVLGKHHSEFDKDESLLSLSYGIHNNKIKQNYLESLGDTHFGMTWSEFVSIVEGYGFQLGYEHEFKYEKNTEKASLYYHKEKGLIIWVTSWDNCTKVNGGKVHGMVKAKEKVEFETKKEYNVYLDEDQEYKIMKYTDTLKRANESLSGCSHGSFNNINKGIDFSYDIREALINQLESINECLDFMPKWNHRQFLWFLDYNQDKGVYDYKAITQNVINKSHKDVQNIIPAIN